MFARRYWAPRYWANRFWSRGAISLPRGDIREAVIQALMGNATLDADLGADAIRDRFAPEDDPLPIIAVTMISLTREKNLSGPNGVARARFAFQCESKNPAHGVVMAEATRRLFDGLLNTELPVAGKTPVKLLQSYAISDEDLLDPIDDATGQPIRPCRVDYLFRFRETAPR